MAKGSRLYREDSVTDRLEVLAREIGVYELISRGISA